jgi:hypothetical protein
MMELDSIRKNLFPVYLGHHSLREEMVKAPKLFVT